MVKSPGPSSEGLGDFTGEKEVIILRSERGVFVKWGVLKTTDWNCILTLRKLLFSPEGEN